MAEAGFIPVLISAHAFAQREGSDGSDDELAIQTLRALANLCFDDGMGKHHDVSDAHAKV